MDRGFPVHHSLPSFANLSVAVCRLYYANKSPARNSSARMARHATAFRLTAALAPQARVGACESAGSPSLNVQRKGEAAMMEHYGIHRLDRHRRYRRRDRQAADARPRPGRLHHHHPARHRRRAARRLDRPCGRLVQRPAKAPASSPPSSARSSSCCIYRLIVAPPRLIRRCLVQRYSHGATATVAAMERLSGERA